MLPFVCKLNVVNATADWLHVGLTCVCSNCIDSTNCTVDEGGRCFLHVWRDLETDEITSSSGCLASHTVLLHCSPNNANPASTTLCCTDQDFCNSELGRDVFPSSNSRTGPLYALMVFSFLIIYPLTVGFICR